MNAPEHITRIIERLDPVDRDALEQHLKDESIMGQLMCLQEIRQAIGDPHGKLMQDEVVSAIKNMVKERDEMAAHVARFNSLMDEIHDDIDCGNEFDDDPIPTELWELRRTKPDASLAEVRAQAVEEAAVECQMAAALTGLASGMCRKSDLYEYANRIRKEAP